MPDNELMTRETEHVAPRESVWKRLTRLFRSGPVVRHKIASGEKFTEPRGTAQAYKKELSSLYVHSLASYGQYERLSRYADYSEMEFTPEIASALDIYADETTAYNENGEILSIESSDEGIKQILETLFFDILNIEFNVWSWTRNLPVRRTSRIPLLDGRNITIEELASEHAAGKENWVYSVEEGTGRLLPGRVNWCGLTRSHSELQRTWLDDGTYVDTTLDHEFILRDGSRRRADALFTGDSLMPFYRKSTNVGRGGRTGGYEKVYDPATGRYVFTHRRVGEIVSKEMLSNDDRWHVIHHSDFNKRNNSPANLKRIGDASHAALHNEIGTINGVKGKDILRRCDVVEKAHKGRDAWLRSDEHRELAREQLLARQAHGDMPSWSAYNDSELHKKHNEIRSKRMKELWADPEWKKRTLEKRFNHKVVMTEVLKDVDDVYCMEVLGPNGEHDRHSFMMLTENGTLDSGVCVSNCKYGDFVLFVDASDSNGILNLLPIPINEIEREEGYDKSDPFAVRFRWLTQGNMILENWQIVHFRLLGNDNFLPYGSSVIEPARRIWRQLILIEDAMLVYRIVRSPERRVFKIDVGNVPPGDIDQFMEQIKTRLRRNQVVDPSTGRVDLRYNPLSVDEDYFIPVRGDKSSDISTLPGGQFTGDIDDVQYIQNKVFAALKIPKAHLGYESELGSKATLAQQDVRFARTIERIQRIVIAEMNKIAIIHLFLLGYSGEDLVDFELKLASSSTISEQQKLELWRTRFEIAGTAQEGMLDRETIYKKIFHMNDKDIEQVREGKKADRLEDLTLESMQAPPELAQQGEAEPAGEKLPGEEELPDTLGGSAPGKEKEEQPPAENVPAESVVHEKKNKGAEGSKAEISVSKGKDLFSTGEDAYNLVFGTRQQTASDPYDLAALKRMITRPFSEARTAKSYVEKRIREDITKAEDIEHGIKEALREIKKISRR